MSSDLLVGTLARRVQEPFAITLGLGLSSSAFFFFSNVGFTSFGIVPSVVEDHSGINVDTSKRVRVFAWFYKKAAPFLAGSTSLTALFYTGAALLQKSPNTGTTSNRLLYTAAISSFLVVPWTIYTMLPINNKLVATADRLRTKTDSTLSNEEESDVLRLLREWQKKHLVRIGLGGVSFTLGLLVALLRV